jgi:hypothetical protein
MEIARRTDEVIDGFKVVTIDAGASEVAASMVVVLGRHVALVATVVVAAGKLVMTVLGPEVVVSAFSAVVSTGKVWARFKVAIEAGISEVFSLSIGIVLDEDVVLSATIADAVGTVMATVLGPAVAVAASSAVVVIDEDTTGSTVAVEASVSGGSALALMASSEGEERGATGELVGLAVKVVLAVLGPDVAVATSSPTVAISENPNDSTLLLEACARVVSVLAGAEIVSDKDVVLDTTDLNKTDEVTVTVQGSDVAFVGVSVVPVTEEDTVSVIVALDACARVVSVLTVIPSGKVVALG